jgi:hypothetical protein
MGGSKNTSNPLRLIFASIYAVLKLGSSAIV